MGYRDHIDNNMNEQLDRLSAHITDQLGEGPLVADADEVVDKSLQLFERVRAASSLWKLLDDIDTLDDSCRDDDAMFRKKVREVQQRRFEFASSDGYRLFWR